MNRKIKVIAGIQIAAFGLLAASAIGLTSVASALPSHTSHSQATVAALNLINKPFRSH